MAGMGGGEGGTGGADGGADLKIERALLIAKTQKRSVLTVVTPPQGPPQGRARKQKTATSQRWWRRLRRRRREESQLVLELTVVIYRWASSRTSDSEHSRIQELHRGLTPVTIPA